MIHNHHISTI